MGTPGGFHPSHHQPLFLIPLVYLVLCFFLYIISSSHVQSTIQSNTAQMCQ